MTEVAAGSDRAVNGLKPDRVRSGESSDRSTTKGDVPPPLLDRYLIERDRQGRPESFFRDHRAPLPAFKDHGRRLTTMQAYPDTIADMLKVAVHRGWTRVRVEGEEAFRRDVWIQARAMGVDVSGYRPRDRDRQASETARPREPAVSVHQDPEARLKMVSAVVKARVSDPAVQRRLLERAADLVARLRENREPSRPAARQKDRSGR